MEETKFHTTPVTIFVIITILLGTISWHKPQNGTKRKLEYLLTFDSHWYVCISNKEVDVMTAMSSAVSVYLPQFSYANCAKFGC